VSGVRRAADEHRTDLRALRDAASRRVPGSAARPLPAEHQSFIETFVLCRGVIRDVEKALGVSYPTVRARLDAAVAALHETLTAASPVPAADPQQRRRAVLDQVAAGRLDPAEAAETLRRLG
jgi:hypothetical protein